MAPKFPKSNIVIQGEFTIWFNDDKTPRKTFSATGLVNSKSGVYSIRNKNNGRLYIGMARDLERRYWRHINDLKKGIHCSKLLQFDYNEARSFAEFNDTFIFEIIIYCRPSELTFYENLLIKYLDPYYNVHKQKSVEIDYEHGL